MKKSLLFTAIVATLALVGTTAQAQIAEPPAEIKDLLQKHTCLVCHQLNTRVVGPAYKDVAKKNYSADDILLLIYQPKPEHWPGYPAMAPMTAVPKADAKKIADWLASISTPEAKPAAAPAAGAKKATKPAAKSTAKKKA